MRVKADSGKVRQIIFVVIVVVIISIICFFVYKKATVEEVDVSEGVKILKQLEEADTAEVDAKIQALGVPDSEDASGEDGGGQSSDAADDAISGEDIVPMEHFRGSVVLGDSIAEELSAYEILDESVVVAKIGVSIPNAGELVDKAVGLNPQNLFIAFGSNDVQTTGGNAEMFRENYKGLLDGIKERLPNTKIYVNGVTAVQNWVLESEPVFQMIPQFNEVLRRLCEEEGVTFIDNSELLSDELYEQDGIHFRPEYHRKWAIHMIQVAGL